MGFNSLFIMALFRLNRATRLSAHCIRANDLNQKGQRKDCPIFDYVDL